jgi:hypothetical protein
MENYKDLVLKNEIGNIGMIRPIKGISIIEENPIGVLEKLGKYEFIYDYRVPNFWDTPMSLEKSLVPQSNLVKEGGSNAKMIAPNTIWSGQSFPQPVKVNSEPQVGTFSKGNIVNVLRFDGNNAIIQNPNFVEPDPNAPKTFWSGLNLVGDLTKQKEFSIPKDYLRKADDTLAVTLSTGILYGANMKPQPVYDMPPVKTLPILTTPVGEAQNPNNGAKPYLVIEEFKLKNYYNHWRTGETHFTEIPIIKGSVVFLPTFPMQDQYDLALQQGKLQELPIVSVVSLVDKQTGKCKTDGALIQNMLYDPCRTVKKGEELRGYIANGVFTNTNQDVIKPQLSFGEYKLVQTNSGSGNNTNNGVVLPVEDNNKNLLMILGAFLVGYLLFNNDTPTT